MTGIISIVVPIFKVGQYLYRCVNSILNQSYADFQLLLVDDGSPDLCGQYSDEYAQNDSRVIVIHQNNGGLSVARNTGIELTVQNDDSEWITFIDSDDWVHKEYLKTLYDAVCEYHQSIVIGGYVSTTDGNFLSEQRIESRAGFVSTEDYWIHNRTNATVAWGKLYQKTLFKDLRYPAGKYHEDEYVTYRILFQHPEIVVIREPLYYYFYNDESISQINYLKRFPDIIEAFSAHYIYFQNSRYQKAFRLEIEKYAEAYTNAIYSCRNKKCGRRKDIEIDLRRQLRLFLEKHKHSIPVETRKDIYIAAYPQHEFFIRGFGFLKRIIWG